MAKKTRMSRAKKIDKIVSYMEGKQKYYIKKYGWQKCEFTAKELSEVIGVSKSTRFMQFLEDMVIDGYINMRHHPYGTVGYKFGFNAYTLNNGDQ